MTYEQKMQDHARINGFDQDFINQMVDLIQTKTSWSKEKIAYLILDTDGLETMPYFGIDWWINFIEKNV